MYKGGPGVQGRTTRYANVAVLLGQRLIRGLRGLAQQGLGGWPAPLIGAGYAQSAIGLCHMPALADNGNFRCADCKDFLVLRRLMWN